MIRPPRRPNVRKAVVFLPNGFTLLNLFSGIYAIVLASRGRPGAAAFWILMGGVADALDGRVARAVGSGSRFGEELDSLVDAISFGLAPAMIMYFAVLNREGWDWIFVFLFTACAVMRLARFNVEQAGKSKTYFHGLPSPAAGMTLAAYYWFSQTPLYNETILFFSSGTTLADLHWHTIMRFLMVLLAFLMVSDVPYPAVPTVGWRSRRQLVGSVVVFGSIAGLIFLPREFFFPAAITYILYGAVSAVVLGLLDRRSTPEEVYLEDEPSPDDVPDDVRTLPPTAVATTGETATPRRRRRRRRPRGERGDRGNSNDNPPRESDPE